MIRWACLLLTVAGVAFADTVNSSSSVPGVALGLVGQFNEVPRAVFVSFGDTNGVGPADVRAACETAGKVWLYGRSSGQVRCQPEPGTTGIVLLDDPGERGAVTVSVRPLAMDVWHAERPGAKEFKEVRRVARKEAAVLKRTLLTAPDTQWQSIHGLLGQSGHNPVSLRMGAVSWIVFPALAGHTYFDNPSLSLVFRREGTAIEYLGYVEGDVRGFVDIDGDGLPEMLMIDEIGGSGWAYWRLEPKLMAVVSVAAGD